MEIQQLLTAFHVDLCQQQQQQQQLQERSDGVGRLEQQQGEQSAHAVRRDSQEEQCGNKMGVQKRGKKRKSDDVGHGDPKVKATIATKIDTTISASTQYVPLRQNLVCFKTAVVS